MKYFVSADIHGFYTYWQVALKEKGFDIDDPNHKIIICGDLFDRGNEAKEIIDFVLKNKDKIIYIRGNHEDLMDDMILYDTIHDYDISNGTYDTLTSLGYKIYDRMKDIAIKSRLRDVLDLSINYYETSKYIFVHSWIPTTIDNKYYKDWRNASYELWCNSRWINPVMMWEKKIFEPNKTIVSGHFHVSSFWHKIDNNIPEFGINAKFEPFITKEFIGLDACTVVSRKVNCIVLED